MAVKSLALPEPAAVILKEGLDHAAHHVVGAEVLVRELLSRLWRRAFRFQPLLDFAPLICRQGREGPTRGGTAVSRHSSRERREPGRSSVNHGL